MSKLDVTGDMLMKKVSTEWQPLDPIIDALIPTVAPGVAIRRYTARVRTRHNRTGGEPVRLTDRQKQEVGARSIISDRIQSQKKSGRMQVTTRDGVRYVRLRSEDDAVCPRCNLPFVPATTSKAPRPTSQNKPRQQTVVYPDFPQWRPETKRAASE